jgi:hypothetical protein
LANFRYLVEESIDRWVDDLAEFSQAIEEKMNSFGVLLFNLDLDVSSILHIVKLTDHLDQISFNVLSTVERKDMESKFK